MAKEKSERERERNRAYQKEYYRRNRERLLEERRRRYREDEDYREKMRIRDRRVYWFKRAQERPRRKLPTLGFEDIRPLGHIRIKVMNHEDRRYGKEVEVPVYGTAEVGRMLDRDGQTIRKWLKRGVLPEPYFRGWSVDFATRGRNPRLYTEDEARIIYENRELLTRPAPRLTDSAFSRVLHEEFDKLVQGLRPQPRPDPYA